jgi:hypothetical protein
MKSLIFSLVMGFMMSASITFATTLLRVGFIEHFFGVWLEVWSLAYPVAIVCILIYKPIAGKITASLVEMLGLEKS